MFEQKNSGFLKTSAAQFLLILTKPCKLSWQHSKFCICNANGVEMMGIVSYCIWNERVFAVFAYTHMLLFIITVGNFA